MLAGIEAVYFDAVGTLLFPVQSISATYREIGHRHGLTLAETEVRERLKPAYIKQEIIDRQNNWVTDEARERERWRSIILDALGPSGTDECYHELWEYFSQRAAWRVHPETATVLDALGAQGIAVGMASNFDARLLPIVAAFPELKLLHDRVIVSSLVGSRKPGGQFFDAVLQQAAKPAATILFIGDDPINDYQGATNAGMRPVLFNPVGAAAELTSISSFLSIIS